MSATNEILIRGARLAADLGARCTDAVALAGVPAVDLRIVDGTIVERGTALEPRAGERVIEADGLIAMTGLVDLHTHLREPGFEQSETVLTGTRAAAAGGFTTVFAMANTMPVADTAGVVEQVQALGDAAGYATVRPIGAVTEDLAGERLSEIGAMAESRAGVRVFSDDGKCVHDPLLMRRALEYVKTFDGVIAQHAQDPRLTEGAQMNEGTLSSELGLKGWPAVAEESIIARDVLLAEHVGARLHICHLSTAGSVEVLRWAKSRGIPVTAEVTPHHLILTEELARSYDARYKVNPPLRRESDVLALRAAVADGTIDIIATDHAPHPVEAKDCEWDAAAFGMVGLESALPVAQATLVANGHASWAELERLLSAKPAEIGRLSGHPTALDAGQPADLVLVDPSGVSAFGPEKLRGLSANSPFLGMELPGRVHTTIRRGVITLDDGVLADAAAVAAAAQGRGSSA
ncbi:MULTISPECIES: dihydroorotase [unclassified Leucobacter]|uniref:dihydroorotase n=1 Tax=unclassified Leucobacter TaxID=2621730 RepID=UPI00165E5761|nr:MULTISPECIES: dihydroorotase [unclassified Leucobacter]MBC9926827.1 dihydroorotase [Leucobacter sp. cx-169]